MKRVRFAPSPTGTLHVGNALSAVANRRFGDWLLLRIDDTDIARNIAGGEEGILDDLRWLGIDWEEGPVRQSDRAERHLEAAHAAGLPQRELRANDELDRQLFGGHVRFDDAVDPIAVGQRNSRQRQLGGPLDELTRVTGALEKAEVGFDPQGYVIN